jgi:tetratricopeptide (TPR) repeat protein
VSTTPIGFSVRPALSYEGFSRPSPATSSWRYIWSVVNLRFCSLLVALLLTFASVDDAFAGEATDSRARAAALLREGARAYSEGNFQEAVDRLLEARQLSAEPVLLYNLGRAYEKLGRFRDAADIYERYLVEAPNIPDRPAVEATILQLRRQADQEDALRRAQATAQQPSTPNQRSTSSATSIVERTEYTPAPWFVGGAGIVAAGAGIFFGLSSRSNIDDTTAIRSQRDAAASYDDAKSDALLANVSFVAAGVLITTAAAWLVLRSTKSIRF